MDNPDRTYEVDLSGLVYGGAALGRLPDGRAVFVPYALPGERVRVRLVEEKRGHAQAELVEVIEASRDRIPPRCRHFARCGGCHYQHIPYQRQLEFKAGILSDQLARLGGIQAPVNPMVPSHDPWNYRNTIQFHLAPVGNTGGWSLGFQSARSSSVIPIQECHLPEPALNELWPRLDMEPIPGLKRVGLRVGAGEEVMLILEGDSLQTPEFSVDLPISAVTLDQQGSVVLAGDDATIMEVHGRPFQVSPGSFFQVNTLMASKMVDHILGLLPVGGDLTVMDVYCGVGLFSAFLSPRVKRLVAIELSPSACQDFIANLDEFENVELYQGAAEEVLPALEMRADGILVDPPRNGLEKRALQAILSIKPDFIIYVSCDPATLARDLRWIIDGGYRLESVTPFDLFPQTYHIESISFLCNSLNVS